MQLILLGIAAVLLLKGRGSLSTQPSTTQLPVNGGLTAQQQTNSLLSQLLKQSQPPLQRGGQGPGMSFGGPSGFTQQPKGPLDGIRGAPALPVDPLILAEQQSNADASAISSQQASADLSNIASDGTLNSILGAPVESMPNLTPDVPVTDSSVSDNSLPLYDPSITPGTQDIPTSDSSGVDWSQFDSTSY